MVDEGFMIVRSGVFAKTNVEPCNNEKTQVWVKMQRAGCVLDVLATLKLPYPPVSQRTSFLPFCPPVGQLYYQSLDSFCLSHSVLRIVPFGPAHQRYFEGVFLLLFFVFF